MLRSLCTLPSHAYLPRFLSSISCRYNSTSPGNPVSDDVIITKKDHSVSILLNRPKALNALNMKMVDQLLPEYKALHCSQEPKVVIMKGAGGKAFCAGGDIRAIYDEVVQGTSGDLKSLFFKREYMLNYTIATLPHPHVALLNGITMGGGVGLSVHGRYRVATDNTVFAMPETAIGFICDVGGTYFLPRLPGSLGMYLGLTGARLEREEIHGAGIATHFVPSDKLGELEDSLVNIKAGTQQDVEKILSSFHVVNFKSKLDREAIDRCFGKNTLDEIFTSLKQENSEWAKGVLNTLSTVSPTSLFLVFETIKAGKNLSLEKCLQMEYNVSQYLMGKKDCDFFEGVRAMLVDKDKKPRWKPVAFQELTEKDRQDLVQAVNSVDKKYGSFQA